LIVALNKYQRFFSARLLKAFNRLNLVKNTPGEIQHRDANYPAPAVSDHQIPERQLRVLRLADRPKIP
jgi:hypothetical protein